MNDDARHLAQAEIDRLEEYVADKRLVLQRTEGDPADEAGQIKLLEEELEQRQRDLT